jgi:ribonuclease P protein component
LTAERLPKSSRLTRAGELRALLRQGKSERTGHLDLFTRPSPVGSSRLAVLVPRFTFTAVRRNALRRRLREICRREVLPLLPEPTDVTVRARASAYSARFATLRTELLGSLCRCSPDSAS